MKNRLINTTYGTRGLQPCKAPPVAPASLGNIPFRKQTNIYSDLSAITLQFSVCTNAAQNKVRAASRDTGSTQLTPFTSGVFYFAFGTSSDSDFCIRIAGEKKGFGETHVHERKKKREPLCFDLQQTQK